MNKELKKELQEEIGATEKGYCPHCCEETTHTLQLYDPDDTSSLRVWQCDKCNENIEFE